MIRRRNDEERDCQRRPKNVAIESAFADSHLTFCTLHRTSITSKHFRRISDSSKPVVSMAEEPQPANVVEGADLENVPANAEDRKAADALSKLDAKGDENGAPQKEVDVKALGEAMKNLELIQGGSGKQTAAVSSKKEEAPKKLVKVDAADVNLLVEQLELPKNKATDLLRAHDADAVKAMTAWVSSSA